jgi:hypothetical protein
VVAAKEMDRSGAGLLVLGRRGREQKQEPEQKQSGRAAQEERAPDATSAGER